MFLLPIYQAAAVQYGVPWQVLAAINEVETDYGNDLNVSTAGAVGWMQFMPQTWLQYGVDVQDAGYADPYNPVDAIFAAARYLRAAGVAKTLSGAVFAYNHSQAYVESVLLRAKLIADYPRNVIATLTGLAEGQLPVANALATGETLLNASSTSASRPSRAGAASGSPSGAPPTLPSGSLSPTESAPGSKIAVSPQQSAAAVARTRPERFAQLSARAGAPVLAVQDGKIVAIGRSRRLGRYIVLRDVYGDVFTYAGLGSIARTYKAPKLNGPGHIPGVVVAGAGSANDPAPSAPATAGTQPPLTLQPARSEASGKSGSAAEAEGQSSPGKVRVFADPSNPYAHAAIRRAEASGDLAGGLRLLRAGAVVTQGTVLGSGRPGPRGIHERLEFAISPAGDPGTVAAQPVLQAWRQLYSALHPEGARRDAGLLGATAGDAFLLSKTALHRAVLSDPGISLDPCARHDVEVGAVDSRVLASLVFLSRSGLKPTVGALTCAQKVSQGFSMPGTGVQGPLRAVEITKVNGTPIAAHQGPGSIADLTIRTLLTLQGRFAPSEIESLMQYPGAANTLANPQRSASIRISFASRPSGPRASAAAMSSTPSPKAVGNSVTSAGGQRATHASVGLGSSQWGALVGRIGALPQPTVSRKRSSAAIPDSTHGH